MEFNIVHEIVDCLYILGRHYFPLYNDLPRDYRDGFVFRQKQ